MLVTGMIIFTFIVAFSGLDAPHTPDMTSCVYTDCCDPYFDIDMDYLYPQMQLPSDSSVISEIDPGIAPSGDNLWDLTYSPDGSKVFIVNIYTKNITVFNPAIMRIDTTFAVTGFPIRIATSSEYIVVTMSGGNNGSCIELYDINDYSLVASIDVEGLPFAIRIDKNGDYAYVGCNPSRICVIIDLNTQSKVKVIENFPVYPILQASNGENQRSWFRISGFEILPGGKHLAVCSSSELLIINTDTGIADYTLPISNCDNIALSGDGKFLVAWAGRTPAALARVDLADFTVESKFVITGYSRTTCGIAVNYDGSKAYVGTSSNTAHIVRFEKNDCVKITVAGYNMCPWWIGTSHDYSKVISGSYRSLIVDFEKDKVVASILGHWQWFGCVSPVSNRMVSISPLEHERAEFYSFSDNSFDFIGSAFSGSKMEGDAPRRVAIAPDASVAVISNTMSDNISILNMETLEIDAILHIGERVQNVAITSDSRWAVVCGCESSNAVIVDLLTNSVVANIPTGEWCSVASITPDDKYAYIANMKGQTVSVIELKGASSRRVTDIPSPGQNLTWESNLIFSDLEVSPNGSSCLQVATLDDIVRVIDTSTNAVVASIDVGDYPMQVAYNHNGSRALVSNRNDGSCSLLNIDGASSSLIKTVYVGERPLRVVYDSVSNKFAVALFGEKSIVTVDSESGSVVDRFDYPNVVGDLAYTETGELIVLAGNLLFRNNTMEQLASTHTYFDYCNSGNVLVAVSPGPDMVTHVAYGSTGILQMVIDNYSMPGLSVSPNPGAEEFAFDVFIPSTTEVQLAIYDLEGRRLVSLKEDRLLEGNHSFSWRSELPAGVYALRLDAGGKSVTTLFTVSK